MMNTKQNKQDSKKNEEKITRKNALKKAGKYALLTAATTMLILRPKEAPARS